jgi:hypothetical protein
MVKCTKDFFQNQTIEELLREKATYYNSKNYIIDFWILVQPTFLKKSKINRLGRAQTYVIRPTISPEG